MHFLWEGTMATPSGKSHSQIGVQLKIRPWHHQARPSAPLNIGVSAASAHNYINNLWENHEFKKCH